VGAVKLACRLKLCPGTIDHDRQGVFWRCRDCNRIIRAWRRAPHWQPIKTVPNHPAPHKDRP